MPCKDVTEVIEVILDEQDRLEGYVFAKRTCGQGVGMESLLLEKLSGKSLEALLGYTAESYLTEFPTFDELEEFLSLKHLFAIQGALEVLTGKEAGLKDDPFAASGIQFDEGQTRISGLIYVDLLTEKIKSCGGCSGCGKAEERSPRRSSSASRTPAVAQAATP